MNQFASVSSDDVKDLDLSDLTDSQMSKTLQGTALIRRDVVLVIFSRMQEDLELANHLFPDTPENKEYLRRKESYYRVAQRIKADLGIEIPRMFIPAESEAKSKLGKKVADNAASRRDPTRTR